MDRRFRAQLDAAPGTVREFLTSSADTVGGDRQRRHPDRRVPANVPIFCRAIADSSIGMGCRRRGTQFLEAGQIDVIGDIMESANIVSGGPGRARRLGGGTPKNGINQASVQAEFYSDEVSSALQVVTDVPQLWAAPGSSA